MNKEEFEDILFRLMISYLEGKVELQLYFYEDCGYCCSKLSKKIVDRYFIIKKGVN